MSDTSGTFKHAAVYSAAALMGRVVSFLMLPFYAHMLQAHGYGVISLLDVGLTFLSTMGGYSSHLAIMRIYHEEKDVEQKPKVISTGFYLVTGGSIVLTMPFIVFNTPLAGFFLGDPSLGHLIIFAMLTFIANMSAQVATTWLLIQRRSVLYASINLVRLFMGLSLNIWLIVVKGMGLDGYFISGLVTAVAIASVYVVMVLRDCGRGFDRGVAIRIRDFLLPLVPGNLVRFVSRQFEKVFIRFRIDVNSVGILEMAYRFPLLISMLIVGPFMASWDTKRFEIADQPDAPVTIGRMYTWFLFLLTFGGVLLAVNIELILQILTPPEFHLAHRIAKIEIVTLILDGSSEQLMFGLLYAKHTGVVSRMRGIIAAGKIALAWFFISHWGIYGAAFAAAFAALANVVVSYVLGRRRYPLVLEWGKLVAIVGVGLVFYFGLGHWDVTNLPLYVFIKTKVILGFHDLAMGTFLAEWKGGKLPVLLMEQAGPLAELVVKLILSACFGFLLPLIHRESRNKIFGLNWLKPKRQAG